MPIPASAASFRQVEVGGGQGLLVERRVDRGSPSSAILWSSGGRAYAMTSRGKHHLRSVDRDRQLRSVTDRIIETRGLHKRFGAKLAVADLSLSIGAGEISVPRTERRRQDHLDQDAARSRCADGGSGNVLGAPLGDRLARARSVPSRALPLSRLLSRAASCCGSTAASHGLRGARARRRASTSLLARVDLMDAATARCGRLQQGHAAARSALPRRSSTTRARLSRRADLRARSARPAPRARHHQRSSRTRGTTVFLNSHLLGEVEATCDRVAFVKHGPLVHEIRSQPSRRSSISSIAPDADSTNAIVPAVSRASARHITCRASRVYQDAASPNEDVGAADIARWLVAADLKVYALQRRQEVRSKNCSSTSWAGIRRPG